MATQIKNLASVTYGYGETGVDSAISNTAVVNLIEDYSISGLKSTLNTSFRPGQNITYIVQVENTGNLPLYAVTISDDLGGSGNPLSFVVGSGSLNENGTITQIIPTSTSPLVFTLVNPLASGEKATITYVARVNSSIDSSVASITNTATVTGREESSSGTLVTMSPNPTVTIERENYAQVELKKESSANNIVEGNSFDYVITLENSGNLDANNVVISDTLPTGFSISSISSVSNGVLVTYETSDYNVDSSNVLTLPTGSKTISVPASSGGVNGKTVITITGAFNS